ncbi:DUF1134 domain-containing protein [Iodidimonas nitroreducens]|nr:DUF1134 domain-containing protein [Iodidimonas nitroreducens]
MLKAHMMIKTVPASLRWATIGLFFALLSACASTSNDGATPRTDRTQQTDDNSFDQRTILDASKDVFGEGAEGLGGIIEAIFADLGRPNAYIAGEEAGGALIVGLRYGNGTLHHKIEGAMPVHWTGPSIGFDVGGDAAKVFTLVYNLYDTADIYRRFPQVEGQFYFIGGLGVSYHQRGDVIIAPIRLGVGLRAGANVGSYKITRESTLNPF